MSDSPKLTAMDDAIGEAKKRLRRALQERFEPGETLHVTPHGAAVELVEVTDFGDFRVRSTRQDTVYMVGYSRIEEFNRR